MYTIIFEYYVFRGKTNQFTQLYGPDGAWVSLFQKSKNFISTELLTNPEDPHHFVTIDKWESEEGYFDFLHSHQKQYREIDLQGDTYTYEQRKVGAFLS